MPADNSAALQRAAQRRRTEALQRAHDALRRLDTAGAPINFATLAAAASVSRGWLYEQPELRTEVEKHRMASATRSPRVPAGQRAGSQSQQRRIETLIDATTTLKEENHQLRDEIARLLGERRAAVAR